MSPPHKQLLELIGSDCMPQTMGLTQETLGDIYGHFPDGCSVGTKSSQEISVKHFSLD